MYLSMDHTVLSYHIIPTSYTKVQAYTGHMSTLEEKRPKSIGASKSYKLYYLTLDKVYKVALFRL